MPEKPDQLCDCNRMKVGIAWTTGSSLDVVHGNYTWICKLCALERQITHAEAQVAALPAMRENYRALQSMVQKLQEYGDCV